MRIYKQRCAERWKAGRLEAGNLLSLFLLFYVIQANAKFRSWQVTSQIAGVREVQSLDVVGDADAIHVLLVGKRSNSDQSALLYTETANLGRSWRKPTIIDAISGEIVSRRGNDAQLAVQGQNIVTD